MKQLYRVEAFVYVLAETASEACSKAEFSWENSEAELAEDVEASWLDCYPFGTEFALVAGEPALTCGEIIKEQAKRIKAERLQIKLDLGGGR